MAQQNLDIIINAQDKTKGAFDSATRGVDGFKDKLERMGPQFQAVAVAGTVAFTAIAGVLYKAVDAASEAEKVQAQLEAVLKSTGNAAGLFVDDLNDQAKALQNMTTYSDEAINSAQSLLLTFTNIKGPVFQEAIGTILDMSTALGQDLKSSSIQLGKALNDPINGITALSRVGVSFTDQQKEMITTLVESGKTMDAQRIILKELTTEFGGSSLAQAQTFSGQIQQMKNRLDELGESIGNAVIPKLQELYERFKPVVDKIIEWVEKNPELTAKILMFGAGLAGLAVAMAGIGLVLPGLITAFQVLTGPFGLLVAIVALIVIHFDDLKRVFNEVWAFLEDTGVIQYFKDIWDNISATFQNFLLPALKDLWVKLKELQPVWEFLAKTLGVIILAAIMIVAKALEGLIGLFTIILTVITRVATFFADTFKKAIDGIGNAIEWLVSKVNSLVDSLTRLWDKAKSFGGGVLSGIGNTLTGLFGGKVNDAVITPQGRVIRPSEDDYLIATKNPMGLGGAGGLVLNINGGNYLSESAAYEFGNIIIDRLRTEMKI